MKIKAPTWYKMYADKLIGFVFSESFWMSVFSVFALLYGKLDGWAWVSFLCVAISAREFSKSVEHKGHPDNGITEWLLSMRIQQRWTRVIRWVVSFKVIMMVVGCTALWLGKLTDWQWVALSAFLIGGLEYAKKNAFLKQHLKVLT